MTTDFFQSKDYQKLITQLKHMMPATENSSYHDFYLQSYWEMGKAILKNKKKAAPQEIKNYIRVFRKNTQPAAPFFTHHL
ncbi:MAG: hypothetical protein H7A32_00275 [Deltaproteobacteria bacterium]|nr:hypothetical protein [Deltaproteobacteria bacterium]